MYFRVLQGTFPMIYLLPLSGSSEIIRHIGSVSNICIGLSLTFLTYALYDLMVENKRVFPESHNLYNRDTVIKCTYLRSSNLKK